METPDRDRWMTLPAEEIAAVVAPFRRSLLIAQDGTRRYAFLKDPAARTDWKRYAEVAAAATLRVIDLAFRLGVETVIITVLWPPNFERGDEYTRAMLGPDGLQRLYDALHREVYSRWDARARLSGSWRQARPWVVETMEEIQRELVAATPEGRRLVLWEADAGSILGALLRAAHEVGPDERAVREALYPDGPSSVDIYVRSGKVRGPNRTISHILLEQTDIYVINNLPLDLREEQLRAILYDHLFLRDQAPEDYMSYSEEYLDACRGWYLARPPAVIGLGELDPGGNWMPLGGVAP